ncbi:MAG: OB-fold domain-containing protein [Burkholderiales bacterium]|nr:OB-fold domain-containing protein [Burkholderiales bacterium]
MSSSTEATVADWSAGRHVMAGELFLGLYQPSPETAGFWEGVARGELLFKWCAACARAYHPRRIICPQCSSTQLAWRPASGEGKVYSFSEVHRAPTKAFGRGAPYTVGLIETAEGVHYFCRIVAQQGAAIAIDSPARLDFRVLETGQRLPVFVVSAEGAR